MIFFGIFFQVMIDIEPSLEVRDCWRYNKGLAGTGVIITVPSEVRLHNTMCSWGTLCLRRGQRGRVYKGVHPHLNPKHRSAGVTHGHSEYHQLSYACLPQLTTDTGTFLLHIARKKSPNTSIARVSILTTSLPR